MSFRKKFKDKNLVQNIKSQVFLQFVLIFLVILCVILLTSASLYTNIITGITLSNLRDAIEVTKQVDVSRSDVIKCVEDIERERSVFIEIYGKNPGDKKGEYTQIIYTKYAYDSFYNRNKEVQQANEP